VELVLDGGLLGPLRQHQSRNAVFWLVNFAALYEKYGGNGVLPLRSELYEIHNPFSSRQSRKKAPRRE